LLAACEEANTIVAYNACFEVQRIDQLAKALRRLAPALKKLRKRVVDLLPMVRDHVYHPDFHGSFSLKAVLPALVTGLVYTDLEIKDGGTAAASLEALLLDEASFSPRSERASQKTARLLRARHLGDGEALRTPARASRDGLAS